MLLELKNVFLNEGEKLSCNYELSMQDICLDGIYPFKTPVKVYSCAENKTGLVDLTIRTDFEYSRPCDRCYKQLKRKMSYTFSHRLAVSLMGDGDDDYIETPDYKLELDPLVISDILLELPGKYLCSENCKGLCQQCGKNLNEGDCGCNKNQVDPRLEILKQLIDLDK